MEAPTLDICPGHIAMTMQSPAVTVQAVVLGKVSVVLVTVPETIQSPGTCTCMSIMEKEIGHRKVKILLLFLRL